MNKFLMYTLVDTASRTQRELSPREVEAVEYYGKDIIAAFPANGPTGQRYVPTNESRL